MCLVKSGRRRFPYERCSAWFQILEFDVRMVYFDYDSTSLVNLPEIFSGCLTICESSRASSVEGWWSMGEAQRHIQGLHWSWTAPHFILTTVLSNAFYSTVIFFPDISLFMLPDWEQRTCRWILVPLQIPETPVRNSVICCARFYVKMPLIR